MLRRCFAIRRNGWPQMKKEIFRNAFIKSIPILCSYLFVSMAYGIMMEEAGFAWYDSLFVSMAVYTGAFQFLLITFLSSGASILTIALTAFLMNSRQTFYSLTFVDEFRHMGKKMLYMIHTMTKEDTMFLIALFSRCYWMVGAVAGGILRQVIPFDLEGIDFCMTALFIIIFIDQWEKSENHLPALAGLTVALFCLFVIGEKNFMLPSLLVISGILLLVQNGGMKSE